MRSDSFNAVDNYFNISGLVKLISEEIKKINFTNLFPYIWSIVSTPLLTYISFFHKHFFVIC